MGSQSLFGLNEKLIIKNIHRLSSRTEALALYQKRDLWPENNKVKSDCKCETYKQVRYARSRTEKEKASDINGKLLHYAWKKKQKNNIKFTPAQRKHDIYLEQDAL